MNYDKQSIREGLRDLGVGPLIKSRISAPLAKSTPSPGGRNDRVHSDNWDTPATSSRRFLDPQLSGNLKPQVEIIS
jgi:hypothetical protein